MATTAKPHAKKIDPFDDLAKAVEDGFNEVIEKISHGPAIGTSLILLEELKTNLLKKVKEL